MGFPDSSAGKESACNAGDPSSIPGLGRSTGEGIGYPLQYSWVSLVAQLVKNPPAVRETWVQSRVGTIPWRRERLPTPVFWPGEFHRLYGSQRVERDWATFSFTFNGCKVLTHIKVLELLKDKWKTMKNFKGWCEQKSIWIRQYPTRNC